MDARRRVPAELRRVGAVTVAELKQIIVAAASKYRPLGSSGLEAPRVDLYSSLSTGHLRCRRVKKTGDPARLLEAVCSVTKEIPAEAVAEQIEHLWVDELTVYRFEAHAITKLAEAVILEAINISKSGGIFFTVRITAELYPSPTR